MQRKQAVVGCIPSRRVRVAALRVPIDMSHSGISSTPNFQGVIPGGDSFSIPVGTTTNVSNMGTGFNWTPTLRTGTTLIIVAGDNRGLGTGGSGLYSVSAGLYPNSSCVTSDSPSSTAGPPAGGTYPTNASGATTGGSSRSVTSNPPSASTIYHHV